MIINFNKYTLNENNKIEQFTPFDIRIKYQPKLNRKEMFNLLDKINKTIIIKDIIDFLPPSRGYEDFMRNKLIGKKVKFVNYKNNTQTKIVLNVQLNKFGLLMIEHYTKSGVERILINELCEIEVREANEHLDIDPFGEEDWDS